MERKKSRRIICILLAILLGFNLVTLILQSLFKGDFLRDVPLALLQVSGGSMEPVLHSGDAILVRQKPFSSLKTNDIIVFCRGEELIVHEIVAVGENSVVTQGVANTVPDDPVGAEEYRAVVLCRVPLLGSVWQLYSSAPLFVLWLLLLVLLLFGNDIFPAIYCAISRRKKTDHS